MVLTRFHGYRAALLASVLTVSMASTGRAAPVTDDQARAVAEQVRAWMTGLVTDRVPLAPGLFSVQPAGDNYSLTVPFPPGLLEAKDAAGQTTSGALVVLARPEDGTRWRIESMKMPMDFRLSTASAAAMGNLSSPQKPSAAPPKVAGPDSPATPAPRPMPVAVPSLDWHVRSQSASGIFDTAQATDSHLDYVLEGVSYDAKNLGGSDSSHTSVERYHGISRMHPTPSGGVDFSGDVTMEGYTQVTSNDVFGQIRVSARSASVRGDMKAVMTGQIATLIRLAVTAGLDARDAKGAGAAGAQSAAKQDMTRNVFAAINGLLAGMRVDETVQGIVIEVPQGRGSADSIRFAVGGDAPGSKFQGFMEFGVDGLKLLGLPPQFADLVPRKFVMRPTVANLDVKALTALMQESAAGGANDAVIKAKMAGIFTGSGVRYGIEQLDVDLGFANLTASGNATMLNASAGRGEADITVVGLDALMQRAQTMPEGAQAVAVMAMAKGFGKAEGAKTTWHVSFSEDNKLVVNGIDMSAMAGGGKK